jgi:hypothetical protein
MNSLPLTEYVAIAEIVQDKRAYNIERGGSIRCFECETNGVQITPGHFYECPFRPNPYNPSHQEPQQAESALLDL